MSHIPYNSNTITILCEAKRKQQPKIDNPVSLMSQTDEDSEDNEDKDGHGACEGYEVMKVMKIEELSVTLITERVHVVVKIIN